jgi:hypothetical protein
MVGKKSGNPPNPLPPPSSSLPSPPLPPTNALPPSTSQQTTCPNGLALDANGNCPISTTTPNQRISRPSDQQHHKESNLLGAQELTIKKVKVTVIPLLYHNPIVNRT